MDKTNFANPFDGVLNFRDVGLFVNTYCHQSLLNPGHLFRSARPDAATPADRTRFVEDYKIRTIIDLRTPTEHLDSREKHTHTIVASSPEATPSDPLEPLRISQITYKDINFNGSTYTRALIWQLSWSQMARLFSLYVCGYRKAAVGVLGQNVMAERGLAGLAEDSLEHCTAEVKAVFDILSDPESYPVMVHCTQGKDRTGLVVALVLMLLRVPPLAIDADYRRSESELEPERREKVREIQSIGLPSSFADCPSDWVETVSTWIDRRHGGVEKYLDRCGVCTAQQEVVKKILRQA